MVERKEFALEPGQVAEIDRQYVPFPPFARWPRLVPRKELWDHDYRDLKSVSDGADEELLASAVGVALRAAAFDSGAIEGLYRTDRGLTFSVATQALAWEQRVEKDSSDALALFESQMEAFELVIDFVAEKYPKMTQAWVRRLHEVVTSAQKTYVVQTPVGSQEQPLVGGQYKRHPNHVRGADGEVHAYAPVEMTQSEMQRLLDELDSDGFRMAHPALQASYAHYAFVAVHPFSDGNGRVARALASAFTYRAASVPVLVLAHQRDHYFSALAEADDGVAGPFIAFVAKSCRDAMAMVSEGLKTAQAVQPDQVLSRFREIYVAQGELTHQELDNLGNQLAETVVELLDRQVGSLSLPDGIEVGVIGGSGGRQPGIPEAFRQIVVAGPRYVQIDLKAAPPANAELTDVLDVFVSTGSDAATSVLVRARRNGEQISFGQEDLAPNMSSAARLRLENFLRRLLGAELQELFSLATSSLERRGY